MPPLGETTHVSVSVAANSVAGVGSDLQRELIAVVSEALENVARHSGASQVDLRVWTTDEGVLMLQVEDDGKGFVTDSVGPGHFGLTGMRERAALVGAQVTVSSTPGVGTSVLVSRTLDAVHS